MKSLEQRILELEAAFGYPPGTQLVRVVVRDDVEWHLFLGYAGKPLEIFKGETIEECVKQAERACFEDNF